MEYLVFVIYGGIIVEWILGKKTYHDSFKPYGLASAWEKKRYHYKISAFLNIWIGIFGAIVFDCYLKGKGVVPIWTHRVGVAGFIAMTIFGFYHLFLFFRMGE